jgi:hypothetical protein
VIRYSIKAQTITRITPQVVSNTSASLAGLRNQSTKNRLRFPAQPRTAAAPDRSYNESDGMAFAVRKRAPRRRRQAVPLSRPLRVTRLIYGLLSRKERSQARDIVGTSTRALVSATSKQGRTGGWRARPALRGIQLSGARNSVAFPASPQIETRPDRR